MRVDYIINLKTAQALGLTMPHHVLLQATEVIQSPRRGGRGAGLLHYLSSWAAGGTLNVGR